MFEKHKYRLKKQVFVLWYIKPGGGIQEGKAAAQPLKLKGSILKTLKFVVNRLN